MNSEREALVARVRRVNEHLNPDAPIAWRGNGTERECLRHGDIDALCAEVERLEREREDLIGDAANAHSTVTRLTAEVERLREDAARLDWLEAKALKDEAVEVGYSPPGFECGEYGQTLSSWPGGFYAVACDVDGLYDHATLRAAIDAARTTGGTENE